MNAPESSDLLPSFLRSVAIDQVRPVQVGPGCLRRARLFGFNPIPGGGR